MGYSAATRRDLGFEALKARQRAIRSDFPEPFGLRIHRTLSWLARAESEPTDPAAMFLFLWIAFNAAYADESDVLGERPQGERGAFAWFFGQLDQLDSERRLYACVWERFSGPIRLLLENRYVYGPFWSHHNGQPGYENWETRFATARRAFHAALARQDTVAILSMLFDRLYVLRNQIVHGGATWGSSVNRDQLRDGAEILGCLVPIMADIMMTHAQEDWGRPFYPVVKD
ncbi:HEPN domain-containing protein [Rubellimicrobium mesophilum]|uniref:HEPN domain-containing protein n=1 Tax=Rubellimicrobium mesophilum TaxID=1123067 RepID=UPI0006889F0C|nr:HEPN domain-containing protein [Rubellimicrobium mesophilum]